MVFLSIIGWSKSGKTTFIERFIPALRKRGIEVVTVKHHPEGGELDIPGKDTWRHRQAGAKGSMLLTPKGFSYVEDAPEETSLNKLRAIFGGADLVLVEGMKGGPFPKLEVYRKELGKPPLAERVKGVIAIITEASPSVDLPIFRPDEEEKVADFILGRLVKGKSGKGLELLADGEVVPLNPFLRGLLHRLMEAILLSLKGTEGAQEVILHWRRSLNGR